MRKLFLFACIATTFMMFGCRDDSPKSWGEMRNPMSLEKILFFNLIEKTQYELGRVTSDPTLGTYEMRGYVKISPEESDEIKDSYQWLETEKHVEVSFQPDAHWPTPEKWLYSNEFKEKYMNVELWKGELLFSPKHNVIYFHLREK